MARTMNFLQLDLNLLRLLTVLYRTRSVTQSSRELSLSQPATSHALARLRQALQDELFVRTPAGLVPTRFCEQIAAPIQQQLAALEQTLQSPAHFEPMTEARLDEVMAIEQSAYAHPWSRGNFTDSIRSGYQAQVLVGDDQLIGYFVAMKGVDEVHLLNITVAPARSSISEVPRFGCIRTRIVGSTMIRTGIST